MKETIEHSSYLQHVQDGVQEQTLDFKGFELQMHIVHVVSSMVQLEVGGRADMSISSAALFVHSPQPSTNTGGQS